MIKYFCDICEEELTQEQENTFTTEVLSIADVKIKLSVSSNHSICTLCAFDGLIEIALNKN